MTSDIVLHLYPAAQVGQAGADRMGALRLSSLLSGAFPIGAWGPVQPRENKKVPAGDVIDAMNGERDAVVRESADLLYNLVVLWAEAEVRPQDVFAEMARRERLFGLAEKVPKKHIDTNGRRKVVMLDARRKSRRR